MDLAVNNQSILQSHTTRHLVSQRLHAVNLVTETLNTASLDTNELIVNSAGNAGDVLECVDTTGVAQWSPAGGQLMNIIPHSFASMGLANTDSGCMVIASYAGINKTLNLPDPPVDGFYFHLMLTNGASNALILHSEGKQFQLSYFSSGNFTQTDTQTSNFAVDWVSIPQLLSIVYFNNMWRTMNTGPFNDD